jgi:hypothetical protein
LTSPPPPPPQQQQQQQQLHSIILQKEIQNNKLQPEILQLKNRIAAFNPGFYILNPKVYTNRLCNLYIYKQANRLQSQSLHRKKRIATFNPVVDLLWKSFETAAPVLTRKVSSWAGLLTSFLADQWLNS